MKKLMMVLTAVFSSLFCVRAAEIYVSPTGNDSNNGTTRSTAFKTIAHAIDVASAGQKICVLKGTYEVVAAGTQYDDGAAITVSKDVTVFGETGNFLLERELGRGGMGAVYLVNGDNAILFRHDEIHDNYVGME